MAANGETSPAIAVSPAALSFSAPSQSTTPLGAALQIANTGSSELDWSVAGAAAGSTTSNEGCDIGDEGVIAHDDGTAENGYSGNPDEVLLFTAVDQFVPSYPTLFTHVCVAFVASPGVTSVSYELVIYDDTGPDGSPGQQIGTIPSVAEASGTLDQVVFDSVDISSLGVVVTSDYVFIGVRFNPQEQPGAFVAADEHGGALPAGHGFVAFDDGSGSLFEPTRNYHSRYSALMVRAVAASAECLDTGEVPWLSASPNSGSTSSGSASTATVTVDPTGLPDGNYRAYICIASNDPWQPTVGVPIDLTVGTVEPHIDVAPQSIEVDAISDAIINANFTLASDGTQGTDLDFSLSATDGACDGSGAPAFWVLPTPSDGNLVAGSTISVNVALDTDGMDAGVYHAAICVASNDPLQPELALPITVRVLGPDSLFVSGFDQQGPGGATVYTDLAAFESHVAAGAYTNAFDDLTPGIIDSLSCSDGSFGYAITAADGSELRTHQGFVSMDLATTQLVVTFTGEPITAIGGNFWAIDIASDPARTPITITLADGTLESFTPSGPDFFFGLTTVRPIASISIDAIDADPVSGPFYAAALDNLIVGQAQ